MTILNSSEHAQEIQLVPMNSYYWIIQLEKYSKFLTTLDSEQEIMKSYLYTPNPCTHLCLQPCSSPALPWSPSAVHHVPRHTTS